MCFTLSLNNCKEKGFKEGSQHKDKVGWVAFKIPTPWEANTGSALAFAAVVIVEHLI